MHDFIKKIHLTPLFSLLELQNMLQIQRLTAPTMVLSSLREAVSGLNVFRQKLVVGEHAGSLTILRVFRISFNRDLFLCFREGQV